MDHMLSINKISAAYGKVGVLHDVSLDIRPNESVAIVGANGAGKTALVRATAGLLPISQGEIRLGTQCIHQLPAHKRAMAGVGTVLEGRNLFGELSVAENLNLAFSVGKKRAVETRFFVDTVVELFPFMETRMNAPVSLLSGGEQQMVAIARTLLLQPDLLILDEPSTGLAPKILGHIVEVVGKLRTYGMSILLVEQSVGFAVQISDRAYVMSLGRVAKEIGNTEWQNITGDISLLEAAYLRTER